MSAVAWLSVIASTVRASDAGQMIFDGLDAHRGVAADREHLVLRVVGARGANEGLLEHVLGRDVARRAAFECTSRGSVVPRPLVHDRERVPVDDVVHVSDSECGFHAAAGEQRQLVAVGVPGPARRGLDGRAGFAARGDVVHVGSRLELRAVAKPAGRARGGPAAVRARVHDGVRFA